MFLSHTSELADFPASQSFVDAAKDAVTRADGVIVDMEYFGPGSKPSAETCEEKIAGADVYVAIVGFRYGSPVWDRPELSYTELEFEAAWRHGIPRLVFLISEEVHAPRDVTMDREYGDRQEMFRERLQRELTVDTVHTPADLQVKLSHALNSSKRRPRNAPSGRVKVFISYIAADVIWADWVARVLMLAGYDVTPQDWRFVADQDLARRASEVRESNDCILLLISTAFAASPYSGEDWMAQLARAVQDPRQILPLQVEESELPTSLARYATVDVSGRTPMLAAMQLVHELGRRGFSAARRLRPTDNSVVAQDYPGARPGIWNLLPRNHNFTNRLDTLGQVCQVLQASFDGGRLATCSLHGIAGVGKTEVANEFAHRWKSRFNVIWWISAENSVSISDALVSLARELGIIEIADQKEIIRKMWVELGRRGRWLLIFDNADRRDLNQFWPTSGSGAVLLTSQSPTWGGFTSTALAVDVFTPEAAQTFLRKRSKAERGPAVRMVSEKLGYFPLALEQAGAYVEETQVSIEAYDSLYSAEPTRLLELGWPDRYDRTVATTWAVSVQRACDGHAYSKDLLGTIAFLAPDDIPRELLAGPALPEERRPIAVDQLEFNRLLASLTQFSLVRADPKRIRMHRLFRDVLREQFTSDERILYQSNAVKLVAAAFPRKSDEVSTWPTCGRLLPHVLACTDDIDQLLPTLCADIGGVLQAAGRYLHTRGEYPDALIFFQRALEVREQPEGAAPADLAETLVSLGRVHYHLANLAAAQESTERALEIHLAVHGIGSPEVLGTMFHLSRVLREGDELIEAERVAREALSALEDADSMNSAIAAAGLHVLGDALWRQGRLEAARATFEKALRTRLNLGEKSPKADLAASRKHLGIVYLEMDRHTEAERELQQAYDLFLEEYGRDHPDVVDVDGHLAEVFRRTERLDEALERTERALQVRRDRLEDHPDVAGSLLKYGAVLRDLARHDEAVDALRESVDMFARRMGEGHYYVAEAKFFLARSLQDVDDHVRARRELEEALVVFEAARGPDHASTLRARQLLQELSPSD